jgi:hypothetical protein
VVIDVDVELPGLRDIADEVKPGVIAVTPARLDGIMYCW